MNHFLEKYGFLIVVFPFIGAFINGIFGRKIYKHFGEKPIAILGCTTVFLSFLIALSAFISMTNHGDQIVCNLYPWMDVGFLKANIAFQFDALSSTMIVIITGIGFLIHLYSVGYMKGDKGFYRFFAYLNLFIFSMLTLVLGDNIMVMFVGWEGVGLCSYLLIGFWYQDLRNSTAGNKAFIVNRVGDFGFLIGIFLLFWTLQGQLAATGKISEVMSEKQSIVSFNFLSENVHLIKDVEIAGISVVTLICIFLFIGATGKSAQIPLYVWLPDAMAGPTPVSALIHAATMVTAGVYMIGRLNFLFSMSSFALGLIATVGAITALFAATIGFAQTDIKKVLAYSTVSQLGYMFLGMGVAAYSAGIFHLLTHAFFKACLFLGSGSVILGMHHEQDIKWMGGLKKYMPKTFITFLLSTIAICGIPPFSGFFSKDEILWKAYSSEHGHPLLWLIGFMAAGMTAFYMTRLMILTFYGENRVSKKPVEHGHHDSHGHDSHHHEIKESPWTMTLPLIILAVFAVGVGIIGIPAALGGNNWFEHFLSKIFTEHATEAHHDPMEYVLMAASVLVALTGIGLGILFYHLRPELPGKIVDKIKGIHTVVLNKYYVDEFYEVIFVKGTKLLTIILAMFDKYIIDGIVNFAGYVLVVKAKISGWFDWLFVDGMVNLTANIVLFSGNMVRKIQTGRIQAYLLMLFAGLFFFISIRYFLF